MYFPCHQRDFPEHDVAAAYVPPVKQKETRRSGPPPKFTSDTTYKNFHTGAGTQMRPRYGDFHENPTYKPPSVSYVIMEK